MRAVSGRVWFNRLSAVGWAVAGVAAFPLGWAYSVAFVTIASIYANVKTDWGAAESARAADGDKKLDDIKEMLKAMADKVAATYHDPLRSTALITFVDPDGAEWIAGAAITRLRRKGMRPDEEYETVQLTPGNTVGWNIKDFRVVLFE
jgi:hypothetical protein